MNFPKPSHKNCGIYVIELRTELGIWIKIGDGSDVRARVSSLQSGCPFDYHRAFWAKVEWSYNANMVEPAMHLALADRRHKGEWFTGPVDEETLTMLTKAAFEVGVNIDWQEMHIQRTSTERAKGRTKKLLAHAKSSSELHRNRDIELARANVRKAPTLIDLKSIYRPTLTLKK